MAKILILLGPPGAGKGTQAVRLAADHGTPHVSTGDLFRENLGQGTELGKKAKGFMDAGQLVPDDLVIDMLFDRVARDDCRAGYLLDGFPRTVAQAEALEARLDPADVVRVLSIEVPTEKLVDRLTGRRTCRECGHVHHLTFSPPKAEGVCDTCGGELYQRSDDSVEVVTERMAVYEKQTAPLVDFYASRGLLVSIDGDRTPDEVYAELTNAAKGAAA